MRRGSERAAPLGEAIAMITGIHHVQLAMPRGGEAEARAFYSGVLGIAEVAKPAALAARGGAWFESPEVRIHLGVDEEFRPAKKAHPALLVRDLAAVIARIRNAGLEVTEEEMPGYRRIYVLDPFGNRLELMQPLG